MANYPDPEHLRAEIEKRLTILHENFEGSVSKLNPHKIGVIAQLGSRLLTAEQRADLDQQIQNGEPISEGLLSHLDTQAKPWQGEMLDLDRDRGNQTYKGATNQFANSLGELSTERTNEFRLQREPGMKVS